jgi:hypothetical protein
MACKDCFNGCGDELTSDRCVKYTGPDVPALDICTGDSLSVVEDKLLTAVSEMTTGDGIKLSGITGCSSVTSLFDDDKTLESIVQALVTVLCAVKASVTSIQNSSKPHVFDKKCLSGITGSSSRDAVIQAAINKICSIDTSVTNILNDYVKSSDLEDLISDYLESINTTNVTQNYLKFVPYVAYEYYGPLTNFDGSGKGLASFGFDKVYICNGANGTPDKRGRTAVGAVAGVPGPALDADVDPVLPANVGTNYALNQKFGKSNIILTVPQLPAHSHTITDPGHDHDYYTILNQGGGVGDGLANSHSHGNEDIPNKTTTKEVTNITINAAGSSQPHSNVQPSIAANFIMYIP